MKFEYTFEGKHHVEEQVFFHGITKSGCNIPNASVFMKDEYYGMGQLVRAIKEAGFEYFMLDSMKRFVKI